MQVYLKQNLAFLAVPKTGTTAIETRLKRHADIVFANSRKHVNAAQFHNRVAPFLARFCGARPERVAVMRDPVEQLRSWYRYRARLSPREHAESTSGMSFDDFVLAVIRTPKLPLAAIGSQYAFLTLRDRTVAVHHLFDYDEHERIADFFSDRFGEEVAFPIRNVSPFKLTPLSPEVEQELRQARAAEFALFADLKAAGGYLRPMAV
ncbi:hypothetical protein FGK63_09245 [Ruegeria sediminis]|uniref:Gamma-glutamyl kinase n=1 Tax=Ruegeria sediminis TaxID=2583820 RepID=A0ABY2WXQ2_9RHOB|nr:sulfotransferase family 2 domain-containing protein [Ruegeria sediminis]TMV07644.1 hypothetical protein FGK63_09245 [Ruegeria sediminis]